MPATKRLLDRTRKLSRCQRRVVALVARGLKNREIATKLGIGAHVARNYVSAIYDKIGVSNRVELALWYEARIHEGQVTPVISRYPLETAQGIKEPEKPSVTALAGP